MKSIFFILFFSTFLVGSPFILLAYNNKILNLLIALWGILLSYIVVKSTVDDLVKEGKI